MRPIAWAFIWFPAYLLVKGRLPAYLALARGPQGDGNV